MKRPLGERFADARMRATLGSPWHRRHSHDTLVLEVTGRRSGRRFRIAVSYAADGDDLLVFVDEADAKLMRFAILVDLTETGRAYRKAVADRFKEDRKPAE